MTIAIDLGRKATKQTKKLMRKPVFRIFDQVILKPVCSATETSYNIKILCVESLTVLFWDGSDQIVLAGLHICWSDTLKSGLPATVTIFPPAMTCVVSLVCSCHLLMFSGSLYCKHFGPRSHCSQGSSLIRVHSLAFKIKYSLKWTWIYADIKSRTFSGIKNI